MKRSRTKIFFSCLILFPATVSFGQNLDSLLKKQQEAAPAGQDMSSIFGNLGIDVSQYNWSFSQVKPSANSDLSYSDSKIAIEFEPTQSEKRLSGPESYGFWITNKTSSSIQLVWDKSYVTSLEGDKLKVFAANSMQSINFSAPQKNRTIKAGAKIGDGVIPKDHVSTTHHNGHYDNSGNWVKPWDQISNWWFFDNSAHNCEDVACYNEKVAGKDFKIVLVFLINSETVTYSFTHKIESIVKE